ncbi:MAG: cytochrome c [Arcobacter sp.]|nr:cytochrome c [Arcobacter sp.]
MKILSSIALGILTSTYTLAQTTMCFKENHTSMITIEKTVLNGGLCSSKKSVIDMKKDGWIVDDIKIEKTSLGNNYIYIFKKNNKTLSSLNEAEIEKIVMKKLETRKKEEIEIQKRDIKLKMSKSGKEIYLRHCQSCHGKNADIKSHNTSRPLINLSFTDMKLAIRDYTLGEYDRGRAFIMKPYSDLLTTKRLKDVYSYIQTLKDNNKTGDNK